jgi:hypothetical protein
MLAEAAVTEGPPANAASDEIGRATELNPPPSSTSSPGDSSSGAPRPRSWRALMLLIAALLVGGTLVVYLQLWLPRHVQIVNRLLVACKSGEITSKKDLVNWLSESPKKYHISPVAEDADIEFPESAMVGKIVSFRLQDTEDLVWTVEQTIEALPGDNANDTRKIVELYKSFVERGEKEKKAGKPIEFGSRREINGREIGPNQYKYDSEFGSKRLTYALETDRGFWKIAFIVSDDSILGMDLYK